MEIKSDIKTDITLTITMGLSEAHAIIHWFNGNPPILNCGFPHTGRPELQSIGNHVREALSSTVLQQASTTKVLKEPSLIAKEYKSKGRRKKDK